MNFTAKQARCHYENGNGIPLNIKDNIIERIRDRSTDSTALYIYKRETTAHGLVDKCRFDAVAKWLSSEEMGYKVTKEMYEDSHYPNISYDYRLKVEW